MLAGLTQSQVAKRLGLNSVKAHRLISRASSEGMVKVFVDGDVIECLELEQQLARAFGGLDCEVIPEFDDQPLPLRALGTAGARFLRREIDSGRNETIGVGHGRTLAACVDYLHGRASQGVKFVSLLGGLTRNFSANPHDVIHRLAHKTGSQAYVMPVPFVANSVDDLEIMLQQKGVGEIFSLAAGTDLKVVGIGTTESQASLVETGMIEQQEIAQIAAAGGVGEILGHFFDKHGQVISTDLSQRTMSVSVDELRDSRIVAIAGGVGKIAAIESLLRSGLLNGLVTDERTARELLKLI